MIVLIRGKVRHGKKRGKKLGFPTANIYLHISIPEGIYISYSKIGKKMYRSLTFIGSSKTFGEKDIKAETYIFDFNQNIYGGWISIRLLKKIRGNKTFATPEDLIAQMHKDRQIAQDYFILLLNQNTNV